MMRAMAGDTYRVRSFRGASITAVDARSARTFARHSHDAFGVGLVTHGAQRSASGRGQVEAGRGNLITVNPAEVHDGIPIGGERAWTMLYFSPAIVASLVADLSEGRLATRELHAPVVEDGRVAELFLAARSALAADEWGHAFDELLPILFGRLFDAVPEPACDAPAGLDRVRERIDDDPAAQHDLAELASLVGLSRFQTLRGFARMTGLTPHSYLVQRRLETARRLIEAGAGLADASAGAGFADQSHMHRHFVARYGFTPGAYAAALRA
jgi:AraC-like DNA-binding protein